MKIFRWIKWCVGLLLIVAIGTFVWLAFKGYEMYDQALKEASLEETVEKVRSKPNYTPLNALPKTYLDAVIAVEDHRVYKHGGIDPIAISRAVWNDIKAMSLVEGGSTITQQLAKNLFFTQKKEFTRKFAEIFMAFKIEHTYSKDEILELYLNSIYFGNGYYCVGDACEGYFGKTPREMTDSECTMLAGIPNAPSVYAPTVNPGLAKQRQKQVIKQMVERGYLTGEKAAAIAG